MLKNLWNILNGQRDHTTKVEKPRDLFKIIQCKANDPSEDRISYGTI